MTAKYAFFLGGRQTRFEALESTHVEDLARMGFTNIVLDFGLGHDEDVWQLIRLDENDTPLVHTLTKGHLHELVSQ